MGCDEGQGYFFSRPLDVAAMESLLRTNIAGMPL
jgi:EAL domain-containing protein (putative c-di-GMP-specific phosphodiesterase class I)